MRKICVVVGSRANYSSIKSAMLAIKNHPNLALQTIAMTSAVLDRYGAVVNLMEDDGFEIDAKLFSLIEGETPATMAKSTGIALIELSTVFERLKPDYVLTVGDRFETMATTLAAAYMNIRVAHTMGGEVTGTIDESIRHAVTKFAHVHFPASLDAAKRIERLGEIPGLIFNVGCPRLDLVKDILSGSENKTPSDFSKICQEGVGNAVDFNKPFVLVSQHPVTTEYGEGEKQIAETLNAIKSIGIQAIVLWPNSDAGSEDISRGIRKWREANHKLPFHFFKNLSVATYIHLMNRTACLVGKSSSGSREGAYIGTPVVNIGTRQDSRERGANVLDVNSDVDEIKKAVMMQIEHGKYSSQNIYGDGGAGVRIAEVLSTVTCNIQKTINH